jgi:hypothetical protein
MLALADDPLSRILGAEAAEVCAFQVAPERALVSRSR